MSIKLISWAMAQRNLTPAERLVLFALADHANSDGVGWPSNKTLSETLELHPVTVRKVRARLVKRGLIRTVQRYRDNGSPAPNLYFVGHEPEETEGRELEIVEGESVRHVGKEPEVVEGESARLYPSLMNRNKNRNKNRIDTPQDLIDLFTPEEQAQWLVRFPNIDVLYEAERCLMHWSEGTRRMQRPKSALTNWLNNARPSKPVADLKPNKDPDRFLEDYIRRRGALPGA